MSHSNGRRVEQYRRVLPRVPESDNASAAWRFRDLTPDAFAPARVVERPCRCVRFEDQEVQALAPSTGHDRRCRSRHELRAHAAARHLVRYMEIVQQSPPHRIVIENGVGEPDDHASMFGYDRVMKRFGLCEALGPYRPPILEYISVKKLVGVRAAIVPPPAVRMKRCDRRDVSLGRRAVLHDKRVNTPPGPATTELRSRRHPRTPAGRQASRAPGGSIHAARSHRFGPCNRACGSRAPYSRSRTAQRRRWRR